MFWGRRYKAEEGLGWGGGEQLIFVTYVTEECYYKKKKNQNYAHISPLQKTNLPLQKLGNLALG